MSHCRDIGTIVSIYITVSAQEIGIRQQVSSWIPAVRVERLLQSLDFKRGELWTSLDHGLQYTLWLFNIAIEHDHL